MRNTVERHDPVRTASLRKCKRAHHIRRSANKQRESTPYCCIVHQQYMHTGLLHWTHACSVALQ